MMAQLGTAPGLRLIQCWMHGQNALPITPTHKSCSFGSRCSYAGDFLYALTVQSKSYRSETNSVEGPAEKAACRGREEQITTRVSLVMVYQVMCSSKSDSSGHSSLHCPISSLPSMTLNPSQSGGNSHHGHSR